MQHVTLLYEARELLLARGMAVLATWALLNVVVSGYGAWRTPRHLESFHFHGMNLGWGLVNAGLAAWSLRHLSPPTGLRLANLFQGQLLNENLFLFNTGLDVAYIMTGFYLRALAGQPARRSPAQLAGFGRSLWWQGGFLLVFDAVMWALLHRQGQAWLPLLN
ncbi:hypothetical protein I2I05_14605 [Hymenobacter sp. BT683]|uniref:Uncharacterized protein n=1 Tax=Hymenobacter jeongseonensis TaxID=2791027 RepID=A0ABS0IKE5_9BACT|nr:hypothetical protein [Hymenobacter jeongseonensis]MBF9238632.1 hypothetical protein [Hymenobacter jeongseonensis]